jgi:hypothetical protein
MPKRFYLGLFLLGLIIALAGAYLQTSPGYMDAYYYFYGGEQLAQGAGFKEMFLWNYLDSPTGLPHPAFSYWMPLTSFIAAAGIKLFAGFWGVFRGAQVSFILIAACIPPITAALAWELTNQRKSALISGLLAAFMGYFQPFVVAIDAFGIYMLLGGVFFLTALKPWRFKYLILGLIAGLMHLTRADGLLWFGIAGLAILFELSQRDRTSLLRTIITKKFIINGILVLAGYLVILTPWFMRNFRVFGSLLSPGGSRTLWLLDYDQLFAYPAEVLTFSHWWAAGLPNLISTRFEALLLNLQSTVASLGMVFPVVLVVFGAFHHRKTRLAQLGFSYWLLLIIVMTVVFPFAGIRGGFFHSGAALMPFFWAMIPSGLDVLTEWSVRTFKWETRKIKPFYTGVLFLYVVVFSIGVLFTTIIGADPTTQPLWNLTMRQYLAVESALEELSVDPHVVIVSATPPAFTAITGRPAIAIPDGGIPSLVAVIERYQAGYILIEENHPDELEDLFIDPVDTGDLKYLRTIEGVHLFSWEGD